VNGEREETRDAEGKVQSNEGNVRRSRIVKGWWIAAAMSAGTLAAAAPHWNGRTRPPAAESAWLAPAIGMPGAPPTSVEGLHERIAAMESRLRGTPRDAGAAVLLADALLRQARATNEGRHANRAVQVLEAVLADQPGQYDALRLLGALELSRHRFRRALEVGRRARDARPADAWNYGVIGDALIELGEYDAAFAAFETMVSLRPNADAYARVSYARELRGDLEGALEAMQMAADATTTHDLEAKAWYSSQAGELLLKLHRVADAEREFRRAMFLFPHYPHAVIGQGKVAMIKGDSEGALRILREQLERTPSLDLAARVGDLYRLRGAGDEAERYYELAETLAGPPAAQTDVALASFLADRHRQPELALKVAQAVAATRDDIFTNDALAWALFVNGRIDEARAASGRALRTGTRDEAIRRHAAAIGAAATAGR
jgi:tetratricopeptide (TPR) repeat protein